MDSKAVTLSGPQKNVRKKELNIIFFVDASRTRSFSFSLSKVKVFTAAVIFVGLWALVSPWIIYSVSTDSTQLSVRLSHLLTTIFDYQTRYDAVYENAYPSGSDRPERDAVAIQDSVNDTSVKGDITGLAAKSLVNEKDVKQKNMPVQAALVDKAKTVQPQSGIEIDEPSFSLAKQNLVVDFAIKNLNKDQRATGFVWAIARLRTAQGQDFYLAQPPSVQVDSTGIARQPNKSTKFTIKRFKPVSVEFDRPENMAGTYQEVKIFIVDETGKKQDYRFPVELSAASAKLSPSSNTPSNDMNGRDLVDPPATESSVLGLDHEDHEGN